MPDEPHKIAPTIHVESLVSAQTGKPVVHVHWGPMDGKLTPAEAREHARKIMEVALAAEMDAFVVAFMHEKVGLELGAAVMVLRDFREWREKHHND
jgi:hypothetical protein